MKGGFRLTKWLSNVRNVLVEIPEHERTSSVVNLDIEDLPTACTLGLKWNEEADKFIWDVSTKFQHLVGTKPMTRRGILSIVSSLFDPLGFIAPYIMESRGGAVVRALAYNQCVPGTIPGPGVICGLSLLLVLALAPRVFLRVLRFSSLLKNQHF